MALSQEILNESELAKAKVTQSECLDDDYKKQLLNILHLTTIATNGISPEEKIQKMTEAIHMLAVSQISFITSVEDTIQRSIERANARQCQNCRAMKHAEEVDEQREKEMLIEEWKKANGIKDSEVQAQTYSWTDTLKTILAKPYIYIFLTFAFISPYGVQILEKLLAFYAK